MLGGDWGSGQAPHPGTGSDLQYISLGPVPALPDSPWEWSQGRPRPPVGGMGRWGGGGRCVLKTLGKRDRFRKGKAGPVTRKASVPRSGFFTDPVWRIK